ncbi:ubiquitin-related domain-containing protein [Baffinella frigidus]|nr:ubiquitin-related domain-containing protein [Cryptophyta sp. CCMP2293]
MQIFARTPAGKTIVVQISGDEQIEDVKQRVAAVSGVPASEQRVLFGGRQLQDDATLGGAGVGDGATVQVLMRLRGGAAAKAKMEAEQKASKEASVKEYSSWYAPYFTASQDLLP